MKLGHALLNIQLILRQSGCKNNYIVFLNLSPLLQIYPFYCGKYCLDNKRYKHWKFLQMNIKIYLLNEKILIEYSYYKLLGNFLLTSIAKINGNIMRISPSNFDVLIDAHRKRQGTDTFTLSFLNVF